MELNNDFYRRAGLIRISRLSSQNSLSDLKNSLFD